MTIYFRGLLNFATCCRASMQAPIEDSGSAPSMSIVLAAIALPMLELGLTYSHSLIRSLVLSGTLSRSLESQDSGSELMGASLVGGADEEADVLGALVCGG